MLDSEAEFRLDTNFTLAVAFYARVERDALLRPLFPGKKSFTCAIEEFAAFLAQFLGGPSEDSQRRWWLSLRESHLRFQYGIRLGQIADRKTTVDELKRASLVMRAQSYRRRLFAEFEHAKAAFLP